MNRAAIALPLATVATMAMGGCTGANHVDRQGHAAAPAAVAVGEPVDCIQASLIDDTRVHDDYTIDFRMRDGKVYRNTLPNRCPALGFDKRFAYKLATDRLCSIDTITVLQSGSSIPGPTCGLGKFVPVELTG